ncbi:MAG TPA: N-6 DNA methylase [Candidatus Competibacteraceae bacterium]|nr:N-6 DNA methylase [Candidatus Competibacteraceae bacterium]HRZ06517.1 N-6 DNA methylase [Candidatus Competibacteraceae bacterium]HSA45096.1 N-6 DNA methylase [Candidatus Competibacteraceae bacterium]
MLNLKPHHKAICAYYQQLEAMAQADAQHEGAVAPAFAALLRHCAGQLPNLKLVEQYSIARDQRRPLRADGAIVDQFALRLGLWEAKDRQDDLDREIQKKWAEGYPKDNILFQSPERIVLWQNGQEVLRADIRHSPELLIEGLQLFFGYQPPAYPQWQEAVAGFKEKVQELGQALLAIVQQERTRNKHFAAAFETFFRLCQESINPNLALAAVEEMLIQHLLTERIFRKVFNNPDFINKNIIAREIERVIAALTSRAFSREEFLKKLDHFYRVIEITAATIDDYTEKQSFLNAVYEQFFQGFAIKAADTHGIVYTPQPIVDFMVHSVNELLRQEFNCSLSASGVQIIDPFVGTGNFITRILREIDPTALTRKYTEELHCNEIMLLPYYIASMNIEHTYYEMVGEYQPFEGICLVDTFELAESRQHSFGFSIPENITRVTRQKASDIFVIIGNPPYNARQANENDNNKNRVYGEVEKWVAESYAARSTASNKNALSDPYVKAFAWATERLRNQPHGIIAFVTNNGFLDGLTFDGMRQCLAENFARLYLFDLGGNVRKNPTLSGTTHNVFGIKVGVCITFLVKLETAGPSRIYYASTDQFWRREQKYEFLKSCNNYSAIQWQEIIPNRKNIWLTEGLQADFQNQIALGDKEQKAGKQLAKNVIFKKFSIGVQTGRDAWTYNFDANRLTANLKTTIAFYNAQVSKWLDADEPKSAVDDLVDYEDAKISWTSSLKQSVENGLKTRFDQNHIRSCLYRPFTQQYLYFDTLLTHRRGQFPWIASTSDQEQENRVICHTDKGSEKPFMVLISRGLVDMHLVGAGSSTQCFPFYIYSEDGQHRQENITGWALLQFNRYYRDSSIKKWDIFYYVYGLLHSEEYRQKYAANLRRELPRIPYASDFWAYSRAGQQLADLHLNYQQQPEYPLIRIYAPDQPHDWKVRRMRLDKEKTAITYNDWLTLSGIPPEAFAYRLGNRSALEWVIDQYQVKNDPRSGIVNDPNRPDDPQFIIRLLGQIVQISVETVKTIRALPPLAAPTA